MSEYKYLYSPNSDMKVLFDNVFGINFTRAIITGEEPDEKKWIEPFFTSKMDAIQFQNIIISQLSMDDSPVEKLENELYTSDMEYAISLETLVKLRDNVDTFLQSSSDSMKLSEENSILTICGLGCAGVNRLYDGFNQFLTALQLAKYLDDITISSPSSLKIYISSNASAAQRNYIFPSFDQMQQQFADNLRGNNTILANLIGTQGSLASELSTILHSNTASLKQDFSKTEIYGYLFPYLTQGIETYGVDESGKGLSKWKTMSMASLVPVYSKNKKYYQQIPIRRSLTKVMV